MHRVAAHHAPGTPVSVSWVTEPRTMADETRIKLEGACPTCGEPFRDSLGSDYLAELARLDRLPGAG